MLLIIILKVEFELLQVLLRLPVRPLAPEQDRGNLDDALLMIRNKNEAIPTNAFAVPPVPLSPLEGLDVALERVLPHPVDRSADGDLVVSGKRAQLSGRLM